MRLWGMVMRDDGEDEVWDGDGGGGRGVYLLLGFLVRIGPKNPVSSGVTPRMRISSASSSCADHLRGEAAAGR